MPGSAILRTKTSSTIVTAAQQQVASRRHELELAVVVRSLNKAVSHEPSDGEASNLYERRSLAAVDDARQRDGKIVCYPKSIDLPHLHH